MEKIKCTVHRVVYSNHENGYMVFVAQSPDVEGMFTVSGTYYIVSAGSSLLVEGDWIEHERYGRQFSAVAWSETVPETRKGIEKYLAGGNITGIGPKMARLIVQAFGEDTFDVIRNQPERLGEIPGIGKVRAQRICDNIRQHNAVRDIIVFLQSYGISSLFAAKIFKLYELESISKIKENPYCLVDDMIGVGFKSADRIALAMGYEKTNPFRLRYGILYVMQHPEEDKVDKGNKGDVFQQRDVLHSRCVRILDVDEDTVRNAIDHLVRTEQLVNDDGCVYLPMFYWSEVGIARRLNRLSEYTVSTSHDLSVLEDMLEHSSVRYNAQQQEAIRLSVTSKVMVLTGGPGTGKTTTLKGIIEVMEACDVGKVLLAAPTGRAAKRMSEATEREAKTIHRLLEFSFKTGFGRDEENPLDGSLLIVDESSMIDQMLMNSMLKAMPSHMRLVLVGDIDQLPSVGAGNVFKDVIDSGCIPVVRLTEIFRQSAESRIIRNAHLVNHGRMPEIRNSRDSDFFFFEAKDDEQAAQLVTDLATRRIPNNTRYRFEDIQVLSPMRQRSSSGCENLNKLIQAVVNPTGESITYGAYTFRAKDRVMQMKNNYDFEVFNGDVGFIHHLSTEDKMLFVDYDEHAAIYKEIDLDDLTLAYATTIHKSQGSEYPVVIIVMMPSASIMLQRNLLYTAITRAKSLCIVVGSRKSIWRCVTNAFVQPRNTLLCQRIRDCFGSSPV